MTAIISSLPGTIAAWVAFIAVGVLGFFALYDRVYRARNKRADDLDTELINKLERNREIEKKDFEETIQKMQEELTHVHNNQLQKKQTDKELEDLRREEDKKKDESLAQMKGQYDSVLAILQGRNQEMDSVLQQAPIAFAIGKETHGLVQQLTTSVDRLVKALEKHTEKNI